ncbi:DNA-packaging protein [Alloyangia pacifica]|uniref:Large terminase phage packaging protein n=1 Tax=Alloyangia pacifica TaxID=311180 RepID=A0A1I6PX78_9RHOB|nr:terminase family protein [Alloyangia pacifica]SDG37798.1 Large terminase phage packaging protein [Alloyangia pacifica]SFS44847.1 Large terminase phage packaging protein [Alloyangia pacifica]
MQESFLNELSEGERLALPFLFEFWALEHQLPPEGDWRSWVIMGGRGAGKTRAGAEWVRAMVEGALPLSQGRCKRVALVGETLDQAREVMVFGDSGILACSPPDRRPVWSATRRCLSWPNGAEAMVFSAHDPEALRGPQFDAAWADELGKWRKARETWDMLQFALRLGDQPRACVTTTPRNIGVLKELLELQSTVVTRAPTEANRANLAASFLDEVRARYGATRLARQELDGEMVSDVDGTLWTQEVLERARLRKVPGRFDRIVVAVDPPAGDGAGSDACGIVVCGVLCDGPPQGWEAFVLQDASVQGMGPTGWARATVEAYERWQADRIVAEVNQGGAMVEAVLRQVAPSVPLRKVTATRGKTLRAEPVAALYEQGRIGHARRFDLLEEQMGLMTGAGFQGQGSPDRVDALVWALTELVTGPSESWRRPRLRVL